MMLFLQQGNRNYVAKHSKKKFYASRYGCFWKGEHLVDSVEMGNSFDIIFLDIEMGQEDGITVARRIRKIDKSVLIVYVTSHEII